VTSAVLHPAFLNVVQIRVVPHEMGACYLTAIRHRYILDIMEEVRHASGLALHDIGLHALHIDRCP